MGSDGATVSANAEIVRKSYECLNRGDIAGLFKFADPDLEIDNSRLVFNPDVYRGREGAERWQRETEEVWDELRLTPVELIDAGDNVMVAVTVQGKGKGSGVEVNMPLFAVWTFRDAKVVRVAGGYRERSQALEAAGLSPASSPPRDRGQTP
jgi:ketosteroid isomerase-like protein